MLDEVDLNKNGELELAEFFQLYSGLKTGQIAQNRLMRYLDELHTLSAKLPQDRLRVDVTLSGGGV